MDEILTSSEVILKAFGRQPVGVPSKISGNCALCGKAINHGDLQIPLALSAAFVDDLFMASRGSTMICGCCAPFLTAEGLRETGYGAFSLKEGAMPFRKWADIYAVLMSPPTPPFVLLRATANNQHMAWRAPVNYNRDVFYVRVGLRDVKIRHAYLIQAVEDSIALGEAISKHFKDRRKKPALKEEKARKTLPNPFSIGPNVFLDVDIKSTEHFTFNKAAFELADANAELAVRLDRLQNITLGESWALRFLLTPDAGKSAASDAA